MCNSDNIMGVNKSTNLITGGRALPIDEIGISIVAFQIAYIMIIVIIISEGKKRMGQIIRSERSQ